MDSHFATLTAISLGDSAYDMIASALIKGWLKPGTRLTIRNLAEVLGTSSTPVRDAVMRLIQDNALEQRSLRDVRVPVLSLTRYREITDIRIALEGLAAARAARCATPDDLVMLRKLIERNEAAIAAADWETATECNQEFHFAVVDIAGMQVLRSVLYGLWLQMGPLIAGYYSEGGREMIDHHYELVDALTKADVEAAKAALTRDITDCVHGISEYISRSNSS